MTIYISIVEILQEKLEVKKDCSNFNSLPDISIILKSRKSYDDKELVTTNITLKPQDYIIDGSKIIKNSKKSDFEKFLKGLQMELPENQECYQAFMAIDVPAPRGPIMVFGEYFLRKFYTVFDRDRNVVGISVANHNDKFNTNILNIKTPYDVIDNNKLNNIESQVFKESNYLLDQLSILENQK
jgi:cathepsin D